MRKNLLAIFIMIMSFADNVKGQTLNMLDVGQFMLPPFLNQEKHINYPSKGFYVCTSSFKEPKFDSRLSSGLFHEFYQAYNPFDKRFMQTPSLYEDYELIGYGVRYWGTSAPSIGIGIAFHNIGLVHTDQLRMLGLPFMALGQTWVYNLLYAGGLMWDVIEFDSTNRRSGENNSYYMRKIVLGVGLSASFSQGILVTKHTLIGLKASYTFMLIKDDLIHFLSLSFTIGHDKK